MTKRLVLTAILIVLLGAGTAFAERLAVKVEKANMRSGPATSFKHLWQVEKYHPLVVVDRKGPWRLVRDFEGDRAWIHESLLADIPTVITKVENCNIRSGPGTNHHVRFRTKDAGVPFRVLDRRGKWIHVQYRDGDRGWIHKSLVW